MIRDTWLLLRLQNQLAWNSFKAMRWWRKLTYLLLSIGAVGLGFVSALLGGGAAELISRSDARYEALGPGLILTGALVVLSVSSFGIALGALFLSGDLERLMVAPINRRAVFVAKLLDGMWFYYLLLAVLAAPALVAYGLRLSYSPFYDVLCAVTLLTAPLLGTGVGALSTLLAARFAPARRVREVLTAAAGIIGLLLSLLGQLPRLWFSANSVDSMTPGTEQLTRTLDQWNNAPLPTLWAGRGLVAAGHNNLGAGLLEISIYLVLTVSFFGVCVVAADKLYASGWARMQGSGVAHRKQRRTRQIRIVNLPPELALAFKDWRFITRDVRMLPRLLSPLITLPILYFSFFRPVSIGRSSISLMPSITNRFSFGEGLSGVVLAAGILYMAVLLCSQLSSIGFSMEGRAFWVLKVAPISPWQVLRGKLLAVLIPFSLITTLVFGLAAVGQHRLPGWSFYAWFGIELLGIGLLAFTVGVSVPWAKLDWEDPRKMTPGAGGCIAFMAYLFYALPAGLALCVPMLAEQFAAEYLPYIFVLCIAIAILWTVLFAGGSLLFASRALIRLGES